MQHSPPRSALVEVIGQHLSPLDKFETRSFKKRKISQLEALTISTICLDMFHRNSNERRRGGESVHQSSAGSQLPSTSSSTSASANVGQNSSSSSNQLQQQQEGNELEPTPFHEGATLQLSSDPRQVQSTGVGNLSDERPFIVVSQPNISSSQGQSSQHTQGVNSSWMVTVDRIIGNRLQQEATHQRASPPSSSLVLSSNTAQGVFANSIGNQVPAARREEQLSIDAPNDESSERTKARFRPYQRDQWDQQYKELLKFRQRHGHCHIPHTYKDNPALSRWAKRQRYQYKRKLEHKQSAMSDARQQKLDEVGFVWDLQSMVWQERFQELVEYKTKHGNCNVPCRYDENPTLGMWVKCQRRQYKLFQKGDLSRLSPERYQLLANLGFTWDTQGETSTLTR